MKKIRPIKKTWYDWLINYILDPITKILHGFKDKVKVFLTQTRLNKPYEKRNKLSKPKTQNKINSIRNPIILKKKIKEIMDIIKEVFEHFIKQKKKERLRKKGINDRLTKDRII